MSVHWPGHFRSFVLDLTDAALLQRVAAGGQGSRPAEREREASDSSGAYLGSQCFLFS